MVGAKPSAGRTGLMLAALVFLVLCSAAPSRAVTYVQMRDEALYEQADAIADIVIVRQLPELAGRAPETQYYAAVENVIKGRLVSSTIVLTSLGSPSLEGGKLIVPGAPRFEDGDRVLAFLAGDGDRGYRLLHVGLGAFFKVGTGRRAVALRRFAGATLLDPDLQPAVELVRNYNGFVNWLDRRGRGIKRAPDYFLTRQSALTAPYRLVRVGGMNVRWFEFDDGKTVNWRILNSAFSNTQPQFVEALKVWSRDPVSLHLASGTNSKAGLLRSDKVNAIIFGDPNNSLPGTYTCPAGGIVGLAGFWFSNLTGRWEGRTYRRIREADIVINDGADCLLNNNRRGTAELYTQQIGFSLGIDASNNPNATMSTNLHNDGRGAFLTADDIAALEALYGKASDPEPEEPDPGPEPEQVARPTKLKVKTPKANVVRLRWKDNSKDETGFEIWRRIGDKKWKLWKIKGATKKSLKATDVKPGATYSFRVRARKDDLFSQPSNEVTVTMPLKRLASPEDLAAEATSSTTGTLTWSDKTSGEKLFQIERKEGDGEFGTWMTADANTTSLDFDDGMSGATYTFRMRAKKGSIVSEYSNEASVTMP